MQVDADEEPHHFNKNGLFNKLNRNKRALCINLKRDEGRALFLDLAARSDVVIENFSAGTMARLGIGYEDLRRVNERIIYLAMPGYGSYGPQSDFVAYGPSVEPMTGLVSMLGYSDEQLRPTNIALPDAAGGMAAAAAILSALRRRAGEPPAGPIDLSMQEAMIALLGEFLVQQQLTGEEPPVARNRDPRFAPRGIYRCRGEDNWIAISCTSEADWKRLCAVAQRGWESDPRFADHASRTANHDDLDREIESWCADQEKLGLMARLQTEGVPAGAVMTAPEFMEDPHVLARAYFRPVEGINMGSIRYPGLPVMSGGTREAQWRPAPRMGEHNREVLSALLEMASTEIDRLEASGVLFDRPPY